MKNHQPLPRLSPGREELIFSPIKEIRKGVKILATIVLNIAGNGFDKKVSGYKIIYISIIFTTFAS